MLECTTDHRERHQAELAYASLLILSAPVGFIPSIQSMDFFVRMPLNLRTLMESAGGFAMSNAVTMQKEHLYSGHGVCFYTAVERCENRLPRLYLSECQMLLALTIVWLHLCRIAELTVRAFGRDQTWCIREDDYRLFLSKNVDI